MPGAVVSSLQPGALHALRARRRASEQHAGEKLALLRRLRRQFVDGTLPKHTETQAEQSWNEQVFARVLDYRTLFSTDRLAFHLRPKNYTGSQGRHYDDFALGFFGGPNADRVIASCELKGPSADLDAPSPGGVSAVAQARRAAAEQGCPWTIVSNMREMRLFATERDVPVAVAFLDDIKDSNDLALLCAHFDRAALLGRSNRESDVMTASKPDHPSLPIPFAPSSYRIVGRFSPRSERDWPLHYVEDELRTAIMASTTWPSFFPPIGTGRRLTLPIVFDGGWVSIDGPLTEGARVRVAASVLGHLQVSVRRADAVASMPTATANRRFDLREVELLYRILTSITQWMYRPSSSQGGARLGYLSGEVLDAVGLVLEARPSWSLPGSAGQGEAKLDALAWGDLPWNTVDGQAGATAACICELAIRFRGQLGGVGLSPDRVRDDVARDEKAQRPQMRQLARQSGFDIQDDALSDQTRGSVRARRGVARPPKTRGPSPFRHALLASPVPPHD